MQFGPGAVLQHSGTLAPLIEDEDDDEDDYEAPGEGLSGSRGGDSRNESGALIPGLHPRRSPETPQLRGRAVQFRPNTNSNTPTRDVTQILPACLR